MENPKTRTAKDQTISQKGMEKSLHRRLTYARKLAAESVPVQGTLGEKYLKNYRGIDLNKWPDSIRFHPGIYSSLNKKKLPALITVATNTKGEVQAVQATWLDPSTGDKINKSEVSARKQTFGILKGSSVHLGNPEAKTALIAEGTETGLSLLKAIPNASVWVTLGKANLCQIDPKSLPANVVFCLDNDGKEVQKDRKIMAAVQAIEDQGRDVRMMLPRSLGNQKQDYNDVLKALGVSRIQRDFESVCTPEASTAHTKEVKELQRGMTYKDIKQLDHSLINQSIHQGHTRMSGNGFAASIPRKQTGKVPIVSTLDIPEL